MGTINLHDHIRDAWAVIFTMPSTFDPVHSSEIGAAAQLKEDLLTAANATSYEDDVLAGDIHFSDAVAGGL